MFDISFPELVLVSIIGLLVLGPQRLPKVAAEIGKWVGRARRTATSLRRQLEREIELNDIQPPPRPPTPTPPSPPPATAVATAPALSAEPSGSEQPTAPSSKAGAEQPSTAKPAEAEAETPEASAVDQSPPT